MPTTSRATPSAPSQPRPAGVLVGDGVMFAAGHFYGNRVLQFRPIARILTRERFCAVQEKFEKYGNWVLFVARFLPGLRSQHTILMAIPLCGLVSGLAAYCFAPDRRQRIFAEQRPRTATS